MLAMGYLITFYSFSYICFLPIILFLYPIHGNRDHCIKKPLKKYQNKNNTDCGIKKSKTCQRNKKT